MSASKSAATVNERAEEVFFEILSNPPDLEPIGNYHWLQEHAPVFATRSGMVVLTRYAEVDAILRDRLLGRGEESVQHLTNLAPELLEPVMARWKRTMVFANPPQHTRMRRKVATEFTPSHIEPLRKGIAARVRELLDQFADRGAGNFIQLVASPLGGSALADLLGVPEHDRAELQALSPQSMKVFDPQTATTDLESAARAEIRMADYFSEQLSARREAPRDDLLTRLVHPADGDPLDEIELVAAAANLTNAGNDTTVNMLGNSLYALLTYPDQLSLLRDDPRLIPRGVEELARFDPPLNLNPRTALTACTVAGIDLTPGQIVIGIQGAANRDPARFTDPDRLDVTRDEGPSLSFGGGVHYCMGAHLGRVILTEFLSYLASGFSAVELVGPARRRPGHNLRGFVDLPVALRR